MANGQLQWLTTANARTSWPGLSLKGHQRRQSSVLIVFKTIKLEVHESMSSNRRVNPNYSDLWWYSGLIVLLTNKEAKKGY